MGEAPRDDDPIVAINDVRMRSHTGMGQASVRIYIASIQQEGSSALPQQPFTQHDGPGHPRDEVSDLWRRLEDANQVTSATEPSTRSAVDSSSPQGLPRWPSEQQDRDDGLQS